ncbi:MAG: hypothetical protein F4Y06_02800 [Rhodospirillales bacterium]|nr:hypothetical protein [Rhodospirillales bacterium]
MTRIDTRTAVAVGLVVAWSEAATADYSDAQSAIGQGDLAAAYGACIQAAEAGDSDCENLVGWLALQNDEFGGAEKARQWFASAAKRGHRRAIENLAFLWGRGLGGPVDVERAASLYRAAQAATTVQVPIVNPTQSEPARQITAERLAAARYRGAYAELLKLRALHDLRRDPEESYVSDAELREAEAALEVLASQVEDQGGSAAEIRAAVENQQAIMLRLLARHADAFDPAVRADAMNGLDRITAALE